MFRIDSGVSAYADKDADGSVDGVVQSTINALASLAMLDTRFKGIPASITASAIAYVTRCEMGMSPSWSTELTALVEHDEQDFMETVELLQEASAPLLRSGTGAAISPEEEAVNLSDDTLPDGEATVEVEGMTTPSKDKSARAEAVTPQEKSTRGDTWKTSPTSIANVDAGADGDVDDAEMSRKLASVNVSRGFISGVHHN